jgi:hypothetical protein
MVEVMVGGVRSKRQRLAAREMEQAGGEMREVEELAERLEEWSEGCVACRAFGIGAEGRWKGHGLEGCGEEGGEMVRAAVEKVREVLRWEAYSCCFVCGLPQAMCERYEAEGSNGWRRVTGGRCQFGGVMVEGLVAMWAADDEGVTEWIQEQIRGCGWRERAGEGEFGLAMRWMGRKIRWGGMESNEMSRMFVRVEKRWRSRNEGDVDI